ncbi:hypothetical protein D3C77_669830 [compost metagenome]
MIDIHGRDIPVFVARCAQNYRNRRLESLNMLFRHCSAHKEKPVNLLLKQRINDADFLLLLLICIT